MEYEGHGVQRYVMGYKGYGVQRSHVTKSGSKVSTRRMVLVLGNMPLSL